MVTARAVALACLGSAAAIYDEGRAVKFAKLAGSAYCSTSQVESWSCGVFCEDVPVSSVVVCVGKNTKAFVGEWEGKGLVSVQGTSGTRALIKDLEFIKSAANWDKCSNCKLHGGFLDEWNALESCVKESLRRIGAGTGSSIRTTGHSLGGAINVIAMLDLEYAGWHIEESYHFGTPRTGNEDFAAAWNAKFSEKAFRVTHHRDPVPQVPPDSWIWGLVNWHFEHVEPEVFYDGNVSSGHQTCTVAHDNSKCAERYWDLAVDLFHISDHLSYLDLPIAGCPGGTSVDVVASVEVVASPDVFV